MLHIPPKPSNVQAILQALRPLCNGALPVLHCRPLTAPGVILFERADRVLCHYNPETGDVSTWDYQTAARLIVDAGAEVKENK